jgi:hypothetical protein
MKKRTVAGIALLAALGCAGNVKAADNQERNDDGMLKGTAYLYCQAKKPDERGCTYTFPARINDLEGVRIYCQEEKPDAEICANSQIKEDIRTLKGHGLDPLGIFHNKRITAYCDASENVVSSSTPIEQHCGLERF